MGLRQIFAENVRRVRQAKGISQERLAHDADIDRTYVTSLENSRYAASLDVIERIAAALDIPAHELLIEHPSSGT